MPAAAPRIDSRLVAALAWIDNGRIPIAEVNRRVGLVAARFGLPKPSYEQIRVHVHTERRHGETPSAAEILLDIMVRARPPEALLEHVSGLGVAPRRPK